MQNKRNLNLFLQATNLSNVAQDITLLDFSTCNKSYYVDFTHAIGFSDAYTVLINSTYIGFVCPAGTTLASFLTILQTNTDVSLGAGRITWAAYSITTTTSRLIAYLTTNQNDVVSSIVVDGMSGATTFNFTSVLIPTQSTPVSVTSRANFSYRQLCEYGRYRPYIVQYCLIQTTTTTQANTLTSMSFNYSDIDGSETIKVQDLFLKPNQYTNKQLFTEDPFEIDSDSSITFKNILANETITMLLMLEKQGSLMNILEGKNLIEEFNQQNLLLCQ